MENFDTWVIPSLALLNSNPHYNLVSTESGDATDEVPSLVPSFDHPGIELESRNPKIEESLAVIPGILVEEVRMEDEALGYYTKEDLDAFIQSCCRQHPNLVTRTRELYDAWVGWCEPVGIPPGTITLFGRRLTELGWENRTMKTTRGYERVRIGLRPKG